eukprot:GHVR01141696.1.p1 GENE.GHVR01141696.1~~GHVR01141696.1.p1  ORF type:complete len:280 (+),score=112.92 GHVR01141696.1:124-963(+)
MNQTKTAPIVTKSYFSDLLDEEKIAKHNEKAKKKREKLEREAEVEKQRRQQEKEVREKEREERAAKGIKQRWADESDDSDDDAINNKLRQPIIVSESDTDEDTDDDNNVPTSTQTTAVEGVCDETRQEDVKRGEGRQLTKKEQKKKELEELDKLLIEQGLKDPAVEVLCDDDTITKKKKTKDKKDRPTALQEKSDTQPSQQTAQQEQEQEDDNLALPLSEDQQMSAVAELKKKLSAQKKVPGTSKTAPLANVKAEVLKKKELEKKANKKDKKNYPTQYS